MKVFLAPCLGKWFLGTVLVVLGMTDAVSVGNMHLGDLVLCIGRKDARRGTADFEDGVDDGMKILRGDLESWKQSKRKRAAAGRGLDPLIIAAGATAPRERPL